MWLVGSLTCSLLVTDAMTSIVDSPANSSKRALEVGLTAPQVESLVNSGVASLGALAHSSGHPGKAINDNEFSDWVRANIDEGASSNCVVSAGRLSLEAQTRAAAEKPASGKDKSSRLQPCGKGKSKESHGPKDIRKAGGVALLPTKEAICFNYNFNGYDHAADEASCSRGLYVCAKCSRKER